MDINNNKCNINDLRNQVCNLKYSKQLKKIGIKQKSIWHWYKHKTIDDRFKIDEILGITMFYFKEELPKIELYSAFTVTELINLLPNHINIKNKLAYLNVSKLGNYWEIC